MKIRSIAISEFKAKALSLVSEVEAGECELVVTRHGVPVARVVPFVQEGKMLGASLKGRAKIVGDIMNLPSDTWSAFSK